MRARSRARECVSVCVCACVCAYGAPRPGMCTEPAQRVALLRGREEATGWMVGKREGGKDGWRGGVVYPRALVSKQTQAAVKDSDTASGVPWRRPASGVPWRRRLGVGTKLPCRALLGTCPWAPGTSESSGYTREGGAGQAPAGGAARRRRRPASFAGAAPAGGGAHRPPEAGTNGSKGASSSCPGPGRPPPSCTPGFTSQHHVSYCRNVIKKGPALDTRLDTNFRVCTLTRCPARRFHRFRNHIF